MVNYFSKGDRFRYNSTLLNTICLWQLKFYVLIDPFITIIVNNVNEAINLLCFLLHLLFIKRVQNDLQKIGNEQLHSHFYIDRLFFSPMSQIISLLCNALLDKMFRTRSSNSNSTSEFQFLLSYIVSWTFLRGEMEEKRLYGKRKKLWNKTISSMLYCRQCSS